MWDIPLHVHVHVRLHFFLEPHILSALLPPSLHLLCVCASAGSDSLARVHMGFLLLATTVAAFSCGGGPAVHLPAQHLQQRLRPPVPVIMATNYRQSKREVLIAKGVAGAALLRVAASSQTAAVSAFLAMILVAITPVIAVEAILLAALLCVTGLASYWPTNLLAMSLGAVGVGGAVNGLMVSWGRYRQSRNSKRSDGKRGDKRGDVASARQRRAKEELGEQMDDDGSAGLVALTVGALTAAIVGALP